MLTNGKSRRFEERKVSHLSVKVYCRVNSEYDWQELTQLKDVSKLGARFALATQTEIGQLLQLTMALPRNFRFFDFASTYYSIWGVIRTVAEIEDTDLEMKLFETSVAFIGKSAPESFYANPTVRYDLKPALSKNGLWTARERPRKEIF
jgi:hypothetical protein